MAPQPQGPATRALRAKTGTQDAGSTRDTSPDEENARSAILARFRCEKRSLPGMYAWLKRTPDPTAQPERVHTAKEELNQLESCVTKEPNVRISYHIRYQNGGRSVDVLHRFGEFWLQSHKKFSLSTTPKVHRLFQPLIFVPKYSTCMTAGTELECQFSGLPQLETSTCTAFLQVSLCLTCPSTLCKKK